MQQFHLDEFTVAPLRAESRRPSQAMGFQQHLALVHVVGVQRRTHPEIGHTGNITLIIGSLLGGGFFLLAYRLYHSCLESDARKLMFASFVYLPIIQFTYVFDKIEQLLIK